MSYSNKFHGSQAPIQAGSIKSVGFCAAIGWSKIAKLMLDNIGASQWHDDANGRQNCRTIAVSS